VSAGAVKDAAKPPASFSPGTTLSWLAEESGLIETGQGRGAFAAGSNNNRFFCRILHDRFGTKYAP